ncbi:uncharacterized protein PAC_16241 [Phialocephala subalpina]|uniref:Heterokaryon incompatibility domain-containing protein n=1 Tax=Phialocephala subalpina TaxID=576137 RepID=A0A1L7XMQ6_9HELO|nr:uncharacterized protein PAC_16241 [Phialocephala subalpina]
MQMDDQEPPPGGNALKRKISRIDDGNDSTDGNCSGNSNGCDERPRHSKVARTQSDIVVPEFSALNHTISWSDKGDDSNDIDDSDKSDVEHVRGPQGEQIRPTRRNDIVWPAFPSRSPYCCPKCKAMTGTPQGLGALLDGGYKHYNWYEIQETAALGCALCETIWGVTEHADWDCEDDGSVTRDEILILANGTRLPSPVESRFPGHPLQDIQLHSLEVQIPGDGRRGSPRYQEEEVFYLVTLDSDPSSGFVPGRRESKELSPKAVDKIRQWLDDCLDTHRSCPRRCTPELPRRVLNVGTENSPVRLYQSQKNEKAQYAALSYCWGSGTQQLTTNTSNFRSYLLALPYNLPKTILDAVEVCRKVGIPYLWVDALCIIQDDDSDKLDQMAQMGSIYKNSTITIIAASAEKVTDGFLNGKANDPIAQLPIFVDNSTSGTVYLRIRHAENTYSHDEPIFQRAWTLQELLLSPRALVFDSCQINLKCLEHEFQPVFETYLEFNVDCPDLPVSVFGLVDENLALRRCEESREYYLRVTQDQKWTQIIHDYSTRDLTVFDDRLPALAGIATELAKSWNDIYLAGFWKKTIIQHLGWYRNTPYRTGFPRKNFKGVDCTKRTGSPSWSWVSAPYPVLINTVGDSDAKLVDSSVQLVSERSPFGQVKGASITLEARILRTWDLELTLKFEGWPSQPYDDGIGLDFKDLKPELDNCRLLYLGDSQIGYKGMFLVMEKFGSGRFRRVGYAELSDWKKGWRNLLSSTKREIIVIEQESK